MSARPESVDGTVTVAISAPHVPKAHPCQSYFNGIGGADISRKTPYSPAVDVRVFRYSDNDYAELSIRVFHAGELKAEMSPSELRDLAVALLHAAVDIESSPARTESAEVA